MVKPKDDAPKDSDTTTPGEQEPILMSDGQDPTEIARHIVQGDASEVAEVMDHLDEESMLQQVAGVFMLWWEWAYFEITIASPAFPNYDPPKLIPPARLEGSSDHEFVYDIHDHGHKLATSKGAEMYSVGMSMCKLFYTIEKMIYIMVKRLKDEEIGADTEVQVSFDGHLLAQRKAFESIINLSYNVVVTNFDPGTWGERYLDIVKRLADRGYGYPAEAPRDIYKAQKRNATQMKR